MLARTLAATALLAATAVLAWAAGATGATTTPKKITPSGVDGVKLGKTFKALHGKHLIGRLRRGCELSGPGARAARLRAPLKGYVNFTHSIPRKVTDIGVTAGATARGIGVGSTRGQLKSAFPKARFDHRTDRTFGITLVKIPRNGGGRLQFAVDVHTHKVTLIGIPFIAFCE